MLHRLVVGVEDALQLLKGEAHGGGDGHEDRHEANDLPQSGRRLGVVPTGSIRTWGERLVGNNSCTTVTIFLVRLVARVAGPRPDEAPRILQRRETGSNDP